MVDKRNKNKSLIVSAVVTVSVIAMLVLSSMPGSAVTVLISDLSGSITQGASETFLVTVTMDNQDKFVPVSNITLKINGPTTKQWTFNPTNGMLINPQDDNNISIRVRSSPNMGSPGSGYGYGYGVDSVGYGYGYNFGYGYGYGYNSGPEGGPVSFTYEITLSTTDMAPGSYTATAYLNTGNPAKESFASADASFTIIP
jgi:hypothetical protein